LTIAVGTSASQLFLGIDTGGTYTDAVLWSEETGIVAKSKALTTRYDLAVGISNAVEKVLEASGTAPSTIKLVSMSTTLATNALVEGQGERAALVLIGFAEKDLTRNGLDKAIGNDPVILCPGGHDVFGNESPLDLSPLETALPILALTVSSVAVCALFAIRNPEHELRAADMVRQITDLPVTMSHELSAKLGGPKRALTTLLNARLVSMIDRLVHATESFLEKRDINAPLMVVRGDGALVSARFAKERPIETILSGPAASLVGAHHLTGLPNALVSDIGGTTTDVAILDNGRPRIDPEGASIGGLRTMVEAVAMHTFGLGGDSEVSVDMRGLDARIALGPRRLIPLSLAATLYGDSIIKSLEAQIRQVNSGRHAGRFAIRTGVPEKLAAGLGSAEAALYARIGPTPLPLEKILAGSAQTVILSRLVARGLVHIIGFTPSDAAHVVEGQSNWNSHAARLGAELFRRKKDGRGVELASSPPALAERVLTQVTRSSAEVMLQTAFSEDGLDGAPTVAHALVQRAMNGEDRIARIAISLDRAIVGLGASASLHYAGLPKLLGTRCVLHPDGDVANALGAVVGQIRVSVEAQVSQPALGVFRVSVGPGIQDYTDEGDAIFAAEQRVRELVQLRATEAGADTAEISVHHDLQTAMVEGRRMFIEACIVASAIGRPRIAA
jgi:N-methylhydantoinase A/oxoprolinase/acetone carboxylase beta subunit